MKKLKIILSIVTLLILIIFAAFYNRLTVKHYEIKTDKITAQIKIVLIADLHSCFYGENQIELIKKINDQNPDIILLAGDIADDYMPHDGAIALLEGITEKYPCYYVSGNHEYWSNDIDNIKKMFRDHNVTVLEGNNETITVKEQRINVSGVDDTYIGWESFNSQIESAFMGLDENNYTILLSHHPELTDIYKELSCDLIVSGHAHGGQWRIPFLLNGFLAPNQGFFPKYAGGLYDLNSRKMVVSRGLSRESSRIPRIFNPPELVVIDVSPIS